MAGRFDEPRDARWLTANRLAASETEDAPDDVVRAPDLGADLIEVPHQPRPIVEVALREKERRLRYRERVPKLVRDARPDRSRRHEPLCPSLEAAGPARIVTPVTHPPSLPALRIALRDAARERPIRELAALG